MASQFLFIFTFENVIICKTNKCSLIKCNELVYSNLQIINFVELAW